jgi:hypothetical protein
MSKVAELIKQLEEKSVQQINSSHVVKHMPKTSQYKQPIVEISIYISVPVSEPEVLKFHSKEMEKTQEDKIKKARKEEMEKAREDAKDALSSKLGVTKTEIEHTLLKDRSKREMTLIEKANAEIEKAKVKAEKAKAETQKALVDAEKAKAKAEAIKNAKAEAERARKEAIKKKAETQKALVDAEKAKAKAEAEAEAIKNAKAEAEKARKEEIKKKAETMDYKDINEILRLEFYESDRTKCSCDPTIYPQPKDIDLVKWYKTRDPTVKTVDCRCAGGCLCVRESHKVKFIVFNYYYNKVSKERKLPKWKRSYYYDSEYSSGGDAYNTPILTNITDSSNLGDYGVLITC